MELIKKDDRWDLYNEDGHKIASTLDGCVNKLSHKNCEAIANGYDLDKLAKDRFGNSSHHTHNRCSYKEGFQKALEILNGKKFSEEDMKKAIYIAWEGGDLASTHIIESLQQQTEWDVEIVMERYPGLSLCAASPELDADGCIILKNK